MIRDFELSRVMTEETVNRKMEKIDTTVSKMENTWVNFNIQMATNVFGMLSRFTHIYIF